MNKNKIQTWLQFDFYLIILWMVIASLKNYFLNLFFKPRQKLEGDPSLYGIQFDDLYFKALDDRLLHGWFLKSKTPAKGTVIQCHGNSGNVSNQFPLLLFLVDHGFNIFCFDYGGYGLSEGRPSPDSIVSDTTAALNFIKEKMNLRGDQLVLFGQSLGGAPAAEAMAEDASIRALILEGTFTTYQAMAFETLLGRGLFFFTPFAIPKRGPINNLKKIAPRPLLIIHGSSDGLIPIKFGKELYDKASGEKYLTILHGFHHLQGGEEWPEYENAVLNFLNRVFDDRKI